VLLPPYDEPASDKALDNSLACDKALGASMGEILGNSVALCARC
jgi:hypothetical protein